jgi:hypothetical protein
MPWVEIANLTSLKHFYVGNNLLGDESLSGESKYGEFGKFIFL